MARTWITWRPRGRDAYTNPRSSVAHFASTDGGPTACGRWVPDDFDAIITPTPHGRKCQRCLKARMRELEAETADASTAARAVAGLFL